MICPGKRGLAKEHSVSSHKSQTLLQPNINVTKITKPLPKGTQFLVQKFEYLVIML